MRLPGVCGECSEFAVVPMWPTASRERIAPGEAGLTVTENAARRPRVSRGLLPSMTGLRRRSPVPKGRRSGRNLSGKGRRSRSCPHLRRRAPRRTPRRVRPPPRRSRAGPQVHRRRLMRPSFGHAGTRCTSLGLLQRLVSACCEDGLIEPALKRREVRARVDPRFTIGVEPELA